MNFHYLKSHFSDLLDVNMNIVELENPYILSRTVSCSCKEMSPATTNIIVDFDLRVVKNSTFVALLSFTY